MSGTTSWVSLPLSSLLVLLPSGLDPPPTPVVLDNIDDDGDDGDVGNDCDRVDGDECLADIM